MNLDKFWIWTCTFILCIRSKKKVILFYT